MFGELLLESAPLRVSADATNAYIERILHAVRAHLGMDVAFASNVTESQTIIRYCNAVTRAPFGVGAAFPVDDGYCKRILEGRIPPLIPDAAQVPEVANLACTQQMPIGAHLSVPITFSDGTVYGTFCCFSFEPDHSLGQRDVEMMRAFADLAAAQIEAEMTFSTHEAFLVEKITAVIERDNLTILYQPIYGLAENEVVGVEALARFPDCSTRGPDKWFAEAAEIGLAEDLELLAVRCALRGLKLLPDDVYLAINVSPDVFVSNAIHELLEEIPPGRVVLEITEHAAIVDIAQFRQALSPLRAKVRIAVDDAGAGYSGLRQILDLEPDIIKLDMSLTTGINSDPARAALGGALVTFSKKIGARIVAEGVESAEELDTLRELGIHCVQGNFLHRPMPVASLAKIFLARRIGCSATPNQPDSICIEDRLMDSAQLRKGCTAG